MQKNDLLLLCSVAGSTLAIMALVTLCKVFGGDVLWLPGQGGNVEFNPALLKNLLIIIPLGAGAGSTAVVKLRKSPGFGAADFLVNLIMGSAVGYMFLYYVVGLTYFVHPMVLFAPYICVLAVLLNFRWRVDA